MGYQQFMVNLQQHNFSDDTKAMTWHLHDPSFNNCDIYIGESCNQKALYCATQYYDKY